MQTFASLKNCVLFLLTITLFVGCSKDDDSFSYDLTGSWKVIYFIDEGKKITKSDQNTWPDSNNGDITALFSQPNLNGEGSIEGITVTNSYTGSYTIVENGKLSIGSVATTLINEPEWTKLFKITAAQSFEVRNDILLIYYNDKQNTIALERI